MKACFETCYHLTSVKSFTMKKVGTVIPAEGLWGIRFHSCYPWHTGKDYKHLMAQGDDNILDWVLEFK